MFGLACACMKSIQPCMVPTLSSSLNLLIPYPIVFLDELFDFEHSDIPLKMAPGLVQLCKDGAIVVVATHKPLPIKEFSSRIITLSAGRILQDQVIV
jgi:ABC-type thiamine transport system ATPase subunit